MVREARQGREEAHRIRSEAFLIKKGAGTCLIYSRISVSPSSKRAQARGKSIPGFLFLPHQKMQAGIVAAIVAASKRYKSERTIY
jgi:hypothetical protein